MLFVPDNFNKANIKFITEAQREKNRDYLSRIYFCSGETKVKHQVQVVD